MSAFSVADFCTEVNRAGDAGSNPARGIKNKRDASCANGMLRARMNEKRKPDLPKIDGFSLALFC